MKKLYPKNVASIIIASIIILFACKKHNDGQSIQGTGNGSVEGVITDLNNSPVGNATVTGGTATTTTDANGKFTLTKVQFSSDTVVVLVTKDGFFEGTKKFVSANHTVSNATIQLILKTVSGTITASSGGNVNIQGGGSVNFSSGFVTASNGTAYTGSVSVSANYLNPTETNFNAYAPGDLKSAGANNQQGTLQSFGVVAVEMNDAAGNKLQLAAGKTAAISIPIPSALQNSAPASIPLWYFDVTKGAWKKEGSASKQGSNYIGAVSHFTFWNAGDIAGSSVNLSATFIDSISRKPFAHKLVTIIRYITLADSTSTSSYTDSSGKISGLVPANEVLRMYVHDTCAIVYLKNIGPFSANTDLGTIYVRFSNCNQSPTLAGFTYSVTGSTFPVTVNFSNTSTNAISWEWDFGDGTTSSQQNPSHNYSTAGNYTVKLKVTGPGGNTDSTSQIVQLINQPTTASFTYSLSVTSFPVTANFTNTSTNAISWMWDFGDGTTSTVANPSHAYSAAGDYAVRLNVTGPGGIRDSTIKILHLVAVASDTYIRLTLNGINYSWAAADGIFCKYIIDTVWSRKYTSIEAHNANQIGFSIENGNALLPGNYSFFGGFIISGKSYSHNDNITTAVSEYGAVGGYITGTASGQVFEKSDSTKKFPFSLQYKVTRL